MILLPSVSKPKPVLLEETRKMEEFKSLSSWAFGYFITHFELQSSTLLQEKWSLSGTVKRVSIRTRVRAGVLEVLKKLLEF
jgi:hypothetical protein